MIIFHGVPGSGASEVGQVLSARGAGTFLDVETLLAEHGFDAADLMLQGEDSYRRAVVGRVREAVAEHPRMLHLGTTVLWPEVAALIARGESILFEVSAKTCTQRLNVNAAGPVGIPGFRAELMRRLSRQTEQLRELATYVVDANGSVAEIAESVAGIMGIDPT